MAKSNTVSTKTRWHAKDIAAYFGIPLRTAQRYFTDIRKDTKKKIITKSDVEQYFSAQTKRDYYA